MLGLAVGYVRLELPVFHVGYLKNIVSILQCVCKSCARVMVAEEERRDCLRRLRNPRTEVNARRALFKRLLERCKRYKACPFCGAPQGVVKRAGSSLKLLHDKYSKNAEALDAFVVEFEEAVKHNETLRPNVAKVGGHGWAAKSSAGASHSAAPPGCGGFEPHPRAGPVRAHQPGGLRPAGHQGQARERGRMTATRFLQAPTHVELRTTLLPFPPGRRRLSLPTWPCRPCAFARRWRWTARRAPMRMT